MTTAPDPAAPRDLKPISKSAVPAALAKAEHYRLLNEPWEAESICRDVLRVDAGNQPALITLLLSLTDQFGADSRVGIKQAREVIARIVGEYEKTYYAGLVCERQGKACLSLGTPGCGFDAYEWLVEAMEWFEKAEKLSPPDNQNATLRWNTCVRLLRDTPEMQARPKEEREPFLE